MWILSAVTDPHAQFFSCRVPEVFPCPAYKWRAFRNRVKHLYCVCFYDLPGVTSKQTFALFHIRLGVVVAIMTVCGQLWQQSVCHKVTRLAGRGGWLTPLRQMQEGLWNPASVNQPGLHWSSRPPRVTTMRPCQSKKKKKWKRFFFSGKKKIRAT